MIISITLLVFKFIFTKWLNQDYAIYREEIENNEHLFKEYEPYFFKRVKTYIDLNGAFSLNKNETTVKVDYKRNTRFTLLVLIVLVVGFVISYVSTNHLFYKRFQVIEMFLKLFMKVLMQFLLQQTIFFNFIKSYIVI